MKREITTNSRTIELLRHCLDARLREGIGASNLAEFIRVRNFICGVRELAESGRSLENKDIVLKIKD